ncbi:MAG: ArnT family glycosyltransferase [Bacteroidia bacterium]
MSKTWFPYLLIATVSLLLFVPGLGLAALFDWDEINFAECAREMLVSKDYGAVQIAFEPFWEKPPLFIWMQAASMQVFGVNEFAARFPNAVCGLVTLFVLFRMGKRLYDQRFGLFWAIAYACSILPHFYFKSGIIDPWFNLFIFLGLYQFMLYTNEPNVRSESAWMRHKIVLSAFFISLAVLTKGPVALLIFGLCFLVFRWRSKRPIMSWKHFYMYAGAVCLVPGIWFLSLLLTGRGHLIWEFIAYQIRLLTTEDASHGGSFFYHWIILLFGCFPAAPLFIQGMRGQHPDTPFESHIRKWMVYVFLVVLLLFSLVQTKIVHYSSLCYFPLTYVAAYTAWHIWNERLVWKRLTSILLGITAVPYALGFVLVPLIDKYKVQLVTTGFKIDAFTAGCLEANGNWMGFEWLIGLLFAFGVAFALWWLVRGRVRGGMLVLATTSLLTVVLALYLIVPKIGLYSQDAAIRFWKSKAGQDVYLSTLEYKSYAHYFYGQTQDGIPENKLFQQWRKENYATYYNPKAAMSENEIQFQRQWMIKGPIDKPVFFVVHCNRSAQILESLPELKYIGTENGFVFLKREANTPK